MQRHCQNRRLNGPCHAEPCGRQAKTSKARNVSHQSHALEDSAQVSYKQTESIFQNGEKRPIEYWKKNFRLTKIKLEVLALFRSLTHPYCVERFLSCIHCSSRSCYCSVTLWYLIWMAGRFGQTFLCLSLSTSDLEQVGRQLTYTVPYIYSTNLPVWLGSYPLMLQAAQGITVR